MRNVAQEQATIERFVRWGRSRDSVRAMILTSSRAVPNAPLDVLSDYDLILAVTDIRPLFEDRAWLEDFGPVLVVYRDPIQLEDGLETFAYVTQYENGLKIDFTLWPVELLQRVVAEPQLRDEFDAGYRPTPPSEDEYQDNIEVFFHEATYVAKHLWRDDLMAAKYNLDYAMKSVNLRQMLEWHLEIEHHWSVKPGPYGRRLKRWLRPDLWTELESTYTGAGLEANWEAMFRTIALFRRVAIEVGDHLGYSYPHDLDRRAVAYLQKVKRLDRQAESFS